MAILGVTLCIDTRLRITTLGKWPVEAQAVTLYNFLCMTINKSRGKSLNKVVFAHGQLYAVVSRVTTRKCLIIQHADEDMAYGTLTKKKKLCL
ncbi:hypothetical protein LXL04_008944 [Taraxacum kok-saghyz]